MTTLEPMVLENQYTNKIKQTKKGKDFLAALGWFGLFAISSCVLIPLLTVVGVLLHWDLVINGIYAISNILELAYSGNFSIETIDMNALITASNYTLIGLCVSYIPLIIAMFLRKDVDGGYSKINSTEAFKWIALITGANFVLEIVISFFMAMPFFAEQSSVLATVGTLSTAGNPILALVATGILAPIVEEITLRRGIQMNLCKINPAFGIITASILFGLMHANLFQSIFAALLGALLGYSYYKTNNLWYCTLMHIAVNSSAVLITLAGVNQYVAYGIIPIVFGALYFITKQKQNI